MSVEAHIARLEDRHRSVDSLLDSLSNSPSASDAELKELKQKKLALKDEIARLRPTH